MRELRSRLDADFSQSSRSTSRATTATAGCCLAISSMGAQTKWSAISAPCVLLLDQLNVFLNYERRPTARLDCNVAERHRNIAQQQTCRNVMDVHVLKNDALHWHLRNADDSSGWAASP